MHVHDMAGNIGWTLGGGGGRYGGANEGAFYWRHGGVKEAAAGPGGGPNMHEDARR
jgi:hypothetical protein